MANDEEPRMNTDEYEWIYTGLRKHVSSILFASTCIRSDHELRRACPA
jgi:hypothetical protein